MPICVDRDHHFELKINIDFLCSICSTSTTQLSPAINTMTRPTPPPGSIASIPPLHSSMPTSSNAPSHSGLPPPLFAAPLPPMIVSSAGSMPHPFSAESLIQSNKGKHDFKSISCCSWNRKLISFESISFKRSDGDVLRRELDNRFLDRAAMTGVPSTPFLRQELHHHQHQHTHLHQHQPLIPSAAVPSSQAPIFPPMFKEIPKMGAVDSPFYRTGLGVPPYPGYGTPSLLHQAGLAGPFAPPNHLTPFTPKVSLSTFS